jgi:hypothetical protein
MTAIEHFKFMDSPTDLDLNDPHQLVMTTMGIKPELIFDDIFQTIQKANERMAELPLSVWKRAAYELDFNASISDSETDKAMAKSMWLVVDYLQKQIALVRKFDVLDDPDLTDRLDSVTFIEKASDLDLDSSEQKTLTTQFEKQDVLVAKTKLAAYAFAVAAGAGEILRSIPIEVWQRGVYEINRIAPEGSSIQKSAELFWCHLDFIQKSVKHSYELLKKGLVKPV